MNDKMFFFKINANVVCKNSASNYYEYMGSTNVKKEYFMFLHNADKVSDRLAYSVCFFWSWLHKDPLPQEAFHLA